MQLHILLSVSPLFQLKVDEFESNVNEIKDPYPSADFPGKACPWQGSRKAEEALQRDGVWGAKDVVTFHQPWGVEVLLACMPDQDHGIGRLSVRSYSLSHSG